MSFTKDVIVSPADLSKDLKKIITVKLLEQVIGNCNLKYGYFIKISNIGDIKNGLIMEGSGDIIFNITYKVVLMRPFKGEICEGIIDKIFEEGGIHVKVGPMVVLIPKDELKTSYILDKRNLTYNDEKNNIEFKVGSKVRFRYRDIQFDKNEFKPIGSMKEKYFGPIQENN